MNARKIHKSPDPYPLRRTVVERDPIAHWVWHVQYMAFGWIEEYVGTARTRRGAKRLANRVMRRANT